MNDVYKKNFTIKGFDGVKIILLGLFIFSSGLTYASLFDSYFYRKIYLTLFLAVVIGNISYNILDFYVLKIKR